MGQGTQKGQNGIQNIISRWYLCFVHFGYGFRPFLLPLLLYLIVSRWLLLISFLLKLWSDFLSISNEANGVCWLCSHHLCVIFFFYFPFYTESLHRHSTLTREAKKWKETLYLVYYSLMKKGILWESKNYEKKIVGSTSRSPLSQPILEGSARGGKAHLKPRTRRGEKVFALYH